MLALGCFQFLHVAGKQIKPQTGDGPSPGWHGELHTTEPEAESGVQLPAESLAHICQPLPQQDSTSKEGSFTKGMIHHYPGAKAVSAGTHKAPTVGGRTAEWLSLHLQLKGHDFFSQRYTRRYRQSMQDSAQFNHDRVGLTQLASYRNLKVMKMKSTHDLRLSNTEKSWPFYLLR